MTTDFTPRLKGTRAQIETQKNRAMGWFKGQVWDLLSEADQAEITDNGWPNISWSAERPGDMGSWHQVGRNESTNHQHVWKLGDPTKRYADKRFVIRKNGTVHTDNLKMCVEGGLQLRRNQRQRDDVLAQNTAIWDEHHAMSVRDWNLATTGGNVGLSRREVGMMEISLAVYEFRFSVKKKIKITKLQEFIEWANGVTTQITIGWD